MLTMLLALAESSLCDFPSVANLPLFLRLALAAPIIRVVARPCS